MERIDAEDGEVRLDPQHPWPGLGSYGEHSSTYFSGRKNEALDLAQMIRLYGAVVLSGESGLGKTSLLRAGVFPQLRELGLFPVYLRLDHSADAPAYNQQVIDRILEECRLSDGIETPAAPRAGESLWTWLHREDLEFWSSDNRLLMPVLVFDQFEEAFTRAAESKRQHEVEGFLADLADLAENRLPDVMPEGCDERQDYRIVLSLRKEYLSELETSLSARMPSVMKNRFHLLPFGREAAREVVIRPSTEADLLAPGAAEAIIRAVAGLRIDRSGGGTMASGGEEGDEDATAIEPALLCLLCSELNLKRAPGEKITVELVQSQRDDIIESFYSRAVEGLGEEVERMVETLVTPNGYRQSRTLDEIDSAPGVGRKNIDILVKRRLLRLDRGLGGRPTVELMHDCLAPIVVRRRGKRQQVDLGREKRIKRLKWVAAGMTVVALLSLTLGFFKVKREQEATKLEKEATDTARKELSGVLKSIAVSDDERAAELFVEGSATGSAHLARALRCDETMTRALKRAVATLRTDPPPPRILFREGGILAGPWPVEDSIVTVSEQGRITIRNREGDVEKSFSVPSPGKVVAASLGNECSLVALTIEPPTDKAGGQKLGSTAKPEPAPSETQDAGPEGPDVTPLKEKGKDNPAAEDPGEAPKPDDRKASPEESDSTRAEGGTSGSKSKEAGTGPGWRVVVMDWRSGKKVGEWVRPEMVKTVSIEDKGRRVLFTDKDEGLAMVEVGSDKVEAVALDESGRVIVNAVAPRPGGGWAAVGSLNGAARLWWYGREEDPTVGHGLRDLVGTAGGLWLAPGSNWPLILEETGDLLVVDQKGVGLHRLSNGSRIRLASPDPNGLRVLTIDQEGFAVWWGLLDGKKCRPGQQRPEWSRATAVTDLGRTFLVGGADGRAIEHHAAWHAGSAPSGLLADFGAEVNDVILYPIGANVTGMAMASDDNTIRFVDPVTGAEIRKTEVFEEEPNPIVLQPGGKNLAANMGTSVRLLSLEDETSLEFPGIPPTEGAPLFPVFSLGFSADGKLLHMLTSDGELQIRKVSDPASIERMAFSGEEGMGLLASPSMGRSWVAMVNSKDSEYVVRVIETTDGKPGAEVLRHESKDYLRTFAVDASGRWLTVIGFGKAVPVFDLDKPAAAPRILPHSNPVTAAVFLPGPEGAGPILVTGDSYGRLREWDVMNERRVESSFPTEVPGQVVKLDLSDSGRWLASCSDDGRLVVWDLETRLSHGHPVVHGGTVWGGAFNEQGPATEIISCSRDGTVLRTPLLDGSLDPEAGDALLLGELLEWHARVRFDENGRIVERSESDCKGALDKCLQGAVDSDQKEFIKWVSSPIWERPDRIGSSDAGRKDRWRRLTSRFPGPVNAAYDRDPGDPLHLLAQACWLEDRAHAAQLIETALGKLGDVHADRFLAASLLLDLDEKEKALELVKDGPEEGQWDELLITARILSLNDKRDEAGRLLDTLPDTQGLDPNTVARIVLENFRSGRIEKALALFESLEKDALSSPGCFEVAWAALAAAEARIKNDEKERGIKLAEASQGWFEGLRRSTGWIAEAELGYGLTRMLLAENGKADIPVRDARMLATEAYRAYEQSLLAGGMQRDPFLSLRGIEGIESRRTALAEYAKVPVLAEKSEDILLGRILHLWFDGDPEGARETWLLLLDGHPEMEDDAALENRGMWPYEIEALRAVRDGEDAPADFGPVPSDEEEWELAGLEKPGEGGTTLFDEYTDDELAGRVLHAARSGQEEMAAEAAGQLLQRDASWGRRKFLEQQGWEADEIETFLKVADALDAPAGTPGDSTPGE